MNTDEASILVDLKIAKILANLPSDSLLAIAETLDQIHYWQINRLFRDSVSQCWSARLEGRDDPLHRRLERGEIGKDVYNEIWFTVDLYQRLWELIQISFERVLRPGLTRLGCGDWPSSAVDLFIGAIAEVANNNFSICLEPYYRVSRSEREKTRRLMKKVDRGETTPIEQKLAQSIQSKGSRTVLIPLILAICEVKATRREQLLKAKLKDVYTVMSLLADNEVVLRRNGGSFVWDKGEYIKGSVGGSYARNA